MLVNLLLVFAFSSLIAEESGSKVVDDYDYEYKGKAPFNFTGSVDILSNHILDEQKKKGYSKDKTTRAWSEYNINKKSKTPFNNLKFSSAKLGITLQKVDKNYKAGVQFAIKANPGKFAVDQASLYVKNYFAKPKLKLSARAGYIYGADKKLAVLGYCNVYKTTNLYSMADYLFIPKVSTSPRINTYSDKSIKVMFKGKKIFNKGNNLILGLSYTPHHPNEGTFSIPKVETNDNKLSAMKNHVGIGAKLNSKINNLKNAFSVTFGHAKRYKMNELKMNNVNGIMVGNHLQYKSVGLAINYGAHLKKKTESYSDDFIKNKINTAPFKNKRHGNANGGYVFCSTISFHNPADFLKGTELYLSYMYGCRKTEWKEINGSEIKAKSHIISTGFAVPYKQFTFGGKLEVIKFDNKAHYDEELMNAYITDKDSFSTLQKEKWVSVVSLFAKVKISHDFENKQFPAEKR